VINKFKFVSQMSSPFNTSLFLKQNPAKVTYFLLLVSAITWNLVQLPEIMKLFVAIPAILILPVLFGAGILILFNTLRKDFFEIKLYPLVRIILMGLVGFFSIFVLAFVSLLYIQNITFTVIVIVSIAGIGTFRIDQKESPYLLNLIAKHKIMLLAILIISLLPISIVKYFNTFPLSTSLAWTQAHAYRLISNIANYGIPDTPYNVISLPSLNILYGIVCRLFNVNPLSLLWGIPILLFVLFSTKIYALFSKYPKRFRYEERQLGQHN